MGHIYLGQQQACYLQVFQRLHKPKKEDLQGSSF